jgi:hypothetical protein
MKGQMFYNCNATTYRKEPKGSCPKYDTMRLTPALFLYVVADNRGRKAGVSRLGGAVTRAVIDLLLAVVGVCLAAAGGVRQRRERLAERVCIWTDRRMRERTRVEWQR